jgi:hypothetical protein
MGWVVGTNGIERGEMSGATNEEGAPENRIDRGSENQS